MTAPLSDDITIPRPHVPHGPLGLEEHEADAAYLRRAARDLAEFYRPFGSNLRATIVKLLEDAADAIEADANRCICLEVGGACGGPWCTARCEVCRPEPGGDDR